MGRYFLPFAQERVMSKWENVVDYNLGDSGVHPLSTEELVDYPEAIRDLLSTGLFHPQANGIIELREHIAAPTSIATTPTTAASFQGLLANPVPATPAIDAGARSAT